MFLRDPSYCGGASLHGLLEEQEQSEIYACSYVTHTHCGGASLHGLLEKQEFFVELQIYFCRITNLSRSCVAYLSIHVCGIFLNWRSKNNPYLVRGSTFYACLWWFFPCSSRYSWQFRTPLSRHPAHVTYWLAVWTVRYATQLPLPQSCCKLACVCKLV